MEHKVKISTFSSVLSVCMIMACAVIVVLNRRGVDEMTINIFSVCLVVFYLSALYYSPSAVSVGGGELRVRRRIRDKVIPLDEIESVRLCPPTMAARRVCGSGGFMGYWGWFSERDLGRYFAYYGKSSDCFLVILKNGRKYMLGCENPNEMVDEIARGISRQRNS